MVITHLSSVHYTQSDRRTLSFVPKLVDGIFNLSDMCSSDGQQLYPIDFHHFQLLGVRGGWIASTK